MTNIREAIVGTPGDLIESKSQGYDARLIIRGAGLKARYAIREVMVLLNGIPITDPDSLTRLDFVDTYLVDRIEVVRGPNSTLWGINATGGAINVVTSSPFDRRGGVREVDVGTYGALNGQVGYTGDIGDNDFFNLNCQPAAVEQRLARVERVRHHPVHLPAMLHPRRRLGLGELHQLHRRQSPASRAD